MSIRIITDSASDINQNEFDNVQVLPMTITIDGDSFLDGVDMSKNQFYRLLESSETIPVSSLVGPHDFERAFRKVREAGEEAIVLPISSGLSGTWQSAMSVAEDYPEVSVIDTLQVSGAQKLLVMLCRRLIAEGLSRDEIVRRLESEKKRIVIYAAADTLKYLQKGGRISRGKAVVGGIMGIKPIVTLENGEMVAIGKARGSRRSHEFFNQKIAEVGGIDYSMPLAVGYSGTDMTNLQQYMDTNRELLEAASQKPDVLQIGSAVGTHCGPGAVLVTFFAKRGN